MKKNLSLLLIIFILLMALIGCTTTQFTRVLPYSASVSFPADGPYTILGRVNYVSDQGTSGYAGLLKYAKTVYPGTDDVVNIIVDSENTYSVGSTIPGMPVDQSSAVLINSVYTMSGIAIAYTR